MPLARADRSSLILGLLIVAASLAAGWGLMTLDSPPGIRGYLRLLALLPLVWGLMLGGLCFVWSVRPAAVSRQSELVSTYLSKDTQNGARSLFLELFDDVVTLTAMGAGVYGALWLAHAWGVWGAWGALLLAVVVSILAYRTTGAAGIVAYHLVWIGACMLPLAQGAPRFAAGFAASFSAITVVIALKKRRERRARTFAASRLRAFIHVIGELSRAVQRSVYSRRVVTGFMSFSIALVVAVFVCGDLLIGALPPDLAAGLDGYRGFGERHSEWIPFVAFFLYLGLSIAPMAGGITEALSLPAELRSWVRVPADAVMFIVALLLFIPPVVCVAVLLGGLLAALKTSPLGFHVGVLLGFFVFPAGIARAYSLLTAIALLVVPREAFLDKVSSA